MDLHLFNSLLIIILFPLNSMGKVFVYAARI